MIWIIVASVRSVSNAFFAAAYCAALKKRSLRRRQRPEIISTTHSTDTPRLVDGFLSQRPVLSSPKSNLIGGRDERNQESHNCCGVGRVCCRCNRRGACGGIRSSCSYSRWTRAGTRWQGTGQTRTTGQSSTHPDGREATGAFAADHRTRPDV